MAPAYKKKANLGIGGSVLAVVLVLMLISSGLFFWGLYNYAKSKGYSGWLALLGFLNLIGLIILVVLPNKLKK